MEKHFINSESLIEDSFKLAWQVYEDGYRPNYIIGVWRGGTPIGVAVQEFFSVLGVPSDHIAIRTSHYTGIDERGFDVKVYGLNYIIKQVESEDSLLIVDDVHDTGISIEKICLKPPGNYSASFWTSKMSVLLCGGPTPNISVIH